MAKKYIDNEGRTHTEHYDKNGNLTESVISYEDESGKSFKEYHDNKGKLLRCTAKYSRDYYPVDIAIQPNDINVDTLFNVKEEYNSKRQLTDRYCSWIDNKGLEHTIHEEVFKDKGVSLFLLKSEAVTYKDEKGVEHTEIRGKNNDGSNNILGKSEKYFNRHNVTTRKWDGKGKLLHESVAVEFDDKSVFIEPKKGRLRRLTDRFLGKNAGDVTTVKTAPERKKTNTTLRGILKDGSLSDKQKKTQLRETVAKYREESGVKAPNKKVGEALKKYLPQQKEGR